MDFYGKYIEMCNKIGKSPSAVAIEIGLSKPSVNRWKNGGSPTDATVQKIADFFKVSVDYLVREESEEETEIKKSPSVEITEGEEELIKLFRRVPESQQQMVLQMIRVALNNIE